jgi:hypothetical protein
MDYVQCFCYVYVVVLFVSVSVAASVPYHCLSLDVRMVTPRPVLCSLGRGLVF